MILTFMVCVDHTIAMSVKYLSGGEVEMPEGLKYVLIALIFIHIVISIYLWIPATKAARVSQHSYREHNKVFWLRKYTGALIVPLVVIHIFTDYQSMSPMVNLISRLCLYICIFVHVGLNLHWQIMHSDAKHKKLYGAIFLIALTALGLFACASAIIVFGRG